MEGNATAFAGDRKFSLAIYTAADPDIKQKYDTCKY